MIARISRPPSSERGTALLFALTVTAILFLLATSLAILTRSSTIVEVSHADTTQSFYYAEAGVNRGLAEFKNIFKGYNVPSGSDFSARNFTLNGTAVRYQLSAVAGYPQFLRIPAGKRFAGLNSIDYLYTNVSQTLAPDSSTKAQLGARPDPRARHEKGDEPLSDHRHDHEGDEDLDQRETVLSSGTE